MQILLTTLNAKYIHMNLALRILYGLNKHHKGLAWKEFAIKEDPAQIAQQCQHYEVVAFSCYIWNITQTLAVARLLKELNPTIKILLGGPEVSYDWQDVLKKDEVDFIIVGEGELPFAEFLTSYPNLSGIGNLAFKENGKLCYTPSADSFELTDLTNFNPYIFEPSQDIKTKVAYIETSRGCPYKCEFCLASLDNKVRYLPTPTIKENLLYLMDHGKVIKFLDRTFNVKKDFTLDIFQFILDNHKPGNVFQFEITADIVHPDIVAFIKEKVPKGLFRFEIGIQTVNQKANLEVSRKQNFEKTKGVILQLHDYVEMHLDLIVGLPLDYFSDIQYSFEEVFAIHPPELQLGFLKFLKGTPVREKYEQYGFRFDPNPPYQIIESNYLSQAELHKITQLEEALELYWNKGRAIHTLLYAEKMMGIFPFLVNLGAWFEERSNFHKHSLEDSFNILYSFCQQAFEGDEHILNLVALDYYLHFKVKPKTLFLEEVDRPTKSACIELLKLNHHIYRFICLPINFSYTHYKNTGEFIAEPSVICIQYSGTEKATIAGEVLLSQIELA
ncbi:MAG: B12-binding domain-containing radical SAM protein [Bacteroidetes bacterium B1(2017)]|nr:MAG: B12-binding domain-containing radical SAM protein [Bacteroidetes bacterium B1(2017)]